MEPFAAAGADGVGAVTEAVDAEAVDAEAVGLVAVTGFATA